MAYRELFVVEVREVLRLWQAGRGYRTVASMLSMDRKTVRRYVEAAQAIGVARDVGWALTDEVISSVCGRVRPGAPSSTGASWQHCVTHGRLIRGWVAEGCKVPKVRRLLHRHTAVLVPLRSLQRYVEQELGDGATRGVTVPVADPEPANVLEMDWARLGYLTVAETGERRVLQALIFTPSCSRYTFVWPSFRMDFEAVVEGLEAAWSFYGGVFAVLLPDNMKTIVAKADSREPIFTEEFVEYAQSRGLVADPARVRSPKDKARVERNVSFTRNDFFRGERFRSLEEARTDARDWSSDLAGMRGHGRTGRHPREHFVELEQALLLAGPTEPYDVPKWQTLKVGRDHLVVVGAALYSMPTRFIGERVRLRSDRATVKAYSKGQLVKTHARVGPGGSRIDLTDLPRGSAVMARRDKGTLMREAEAYGLSVALVLTKLLEDPRPWSKMRQAYRLLDLCSRVGSVPVEEACRRALGVGSADVTRIERMVEQGLTDVPAASPPSAGGPQATPLRFQRGSSAWSSQPMESQG